MMQYTMSMTNTYFSPYFKAIYSKPAGLKFISAHPKWTEGLFFNAELVSTMWAEINMHENHHKSEFRRNSKDNSSFLQKRKWISAHSKSMKNMSENAQKRSYDHQEQKSSVQNFNFITFSWAEILAQSLSIFSKFIKVAKEITFSLEKWIIYTVKFEYNLAL